MQYRVPKAPSAVVLCGLEEKEYPMTTTFKRKAANAALAGMVALGCAGAATTTALVSAATDATIAHADEWKYSNGGW